MKRQTFLWHNNNQLSLKIIITKCLSLLNVNNNEKEDPLKCNGEEHWKQNIHILKVCIFDT